MKKVLVLMLVLGMASLANAGLVLTIGGNPAADMEVLAGTVLNFSLVSDTDSSLSYIDVLQGGGAFTLGVVTQGSAVGDLGSVSQPYDNGIGAMEIVATQAWSSTGQAGLILTGTLTIDGPEPVVVQLWDNAIGYDAPATTATISVVPEPATLAILGLGALMLRRKK